MDYKIMNYNKLLNKAREAYKQCVTDAEKRRLESLFPELKEKSNQWRPNEEQLKALRLLNLYGELSYLGQQEQLIKLYDDIKKL